MNGTLDEPGRQFANRVARLQRERGLSNDELAGRAKLDMGELAAILSGESGVDLDVIFLLAGALAVEPGELLDGISWIPDEEKRGGEYRVEGAGDEGSGDDG